jgi:hypothetical protein
MKEEIGQYGPHAGQARDPYAATFGNQPYVGRSLNEVLARDRAMMMRNDAVPTPAAPVTSMVNALRGRTSTLEALLDQMEGKLAPALVSLPESPEKDPGTLTGPQSALTMELGEVEQRLQRLCRRIDTLINRVEL